MDRPPALLTATFALGLGLFGYGVGATLGLLPSGWGPYAVGQYALMVGGGLLAWLVALVVGWSRYRSRSGLLTARDRIAISLLAPVGTVCTTTAVTWLSTGAVTPPWPGWTALGLVVLSGQFYLGTITPGWQRRRIAALEPAVVFLAVGGVLLIDRSVTSPAALLAVSGGAALLFVLVGGTLYLLGTRVGDGTGLALAAAP